MERLQRGLWVLLLWGYASLAAATVSSAPLQALSSYIENSGNCSPDVVEWNREYSEKTLSGETPRSFYYRVLGFRDWGRCARPFFRPILAELQKAWSIYAMGAVTEAEFEAKESELVNLFFAALQDESHGNQMVSAYEGRISRRLLDLSPPQPFFNCTFFGDQPRCMK